MARTKGAKDKAPRKRRGKGAVKSRVVVDGIKRKRGEPLTHALEIAPSDEPLLFDGKPARAAFVSADAPGIYDLDWEIRVGGEYVRVKQPFAVVEQTHDAFGEPIDEPYFTSSIFPAHIRRIYAEGTKAKRVMVLW